MSRERVGESFGYAALLVLGIVAVGSSRRYFTGPSDAEFMLLGVTGTVFLALVGACCFLIRRPLWLSIVLVGVVLLIAIPLTTYDRLDSDGRKILSGSAVLFEALGFPLALGLVVLGFLKGAPARPNVMRYGAIIGLSLFLVAVLSIAADLTPQSGAWPWLADYIDAVQVTFYFYLAAIAGWALLLAMAAYLFPRFLRARNLRQW